MGEMAASVQLIVCVLRLQAIELQYFTYLFMNSQCVL